MLLHYEGNTPRILDVEQPAFWWKDISSKEFAQPGNKPSSGQWLNAWQQKKNQRICSRQCKNPDTVSEDSKGSWKKALRTKSGHFSEQTWRLNNGCAAIHMQSRASNPAWRISAQDYSLKPRQNYEQVRLIKCWHWNGTSGYLHPLPYTTAYWCKRSVRMGGTWGQRPPRWVAEDMATWISAAQSESASSVLSKWPGASSVRKWGSTD